MSTFQQSGSLGNSGLYPNRRFARRVSPSRFSYLPRRASFIAGVARGIGQIPNISVGGALLSSTALLPSLGSEVDLYFLEEQTGRELHAIGQVVRQAEAEFAVLFLWLEEELRRLVQTAVQENAEAVATSHAD